MKKLYRWKPLIFVRNLSIVFAMILFLSQIVLSGEHKILTNKKEIRIKSGDTLWSISRTYFSKDDPREVIDKIKKLNQNIKGYLKQGQILKIPDSNPCGI